MQPNPVIIRIGSFAIYWYGVLIVTGAMLAAHIASRLSRRNGHDPEMAWNLLLIVLVTGIIGARLYHIISAWDYYRAHPGQMFGFQMSGYGIFGAVFGGLLGIWFFTRHYHLRFWEWADYCAPGLILAQAIGRWGNFFNQELYGPPTDLPWGIYIAPENRLPELRAFERFHPTFFYESVLNFGAFLLLYYLARNWKEKRLYGDLFAVYAMLYAVIRFFIEFLRPDAWTLGGIPTAQWVSIGLLLVFGGMMFIRHRNPNPQAVYQPGEPWEPPQDEVETNEVALTSEVTLEGTPQEERSEQDDRPVVKDGGGTSAVG